MSFASKAMKRPFWHYHGDVNIEPGGMFYNLATFAEGHVQVVRLQPCSDAGGPDNVHWIEHLTVIIHDGWKHAFWGPGDTAAARRAHRALHDMPSAERTESALTCCGWDDKIAEWDKLTLAERKHIIFEACIAYGHYDQTESVMVSVGKPEFTKNREGEWKPATILRANVNLRKYVRSQCE